MSGQDRLDHVCVSSIDWTDLWQGPQEVMTRFANQGARVLYIENTGIRGPRLRDARRILRRLAANVPRPASSRVLPPGITVVSPVTVPLPWSRTARIVNDVALARRLPAVARSAGLGTAAIWTFLPTPFAMDVIAAFPRRAAAIYYCVADFEELTDDREAFLRAEADLLSRVDLVFVGGRVLQQRFAGRHDRVRLAPFSVADGFFRDAPTPRDLAAISRPRVGYVGGLHRHVDQQLVYGVARAMPDVQFVFVGPWIGERWAISAPNLHFVGARSHADLPGYVDGFDVCVVPYARSRFTETVWPTKLHEYLARGKPVVATSLPEVTMLDYPPEILALAEDVPQSVAAIRRLLASNSVAAEAKKLADAYRWSTLVDRMQSEIRIVRDAGANGDR